MTAPRILLVCLASLVALQVSACDVRSDRVTSFAAGTVGHLLEVEPARVEGTATELSPARLREERDVPLTGVGKLAIAKLSGLPIEATVQVRGKYGQLLERRASPRDLFERKGYSYVPQRRRFALDESGVLSFLSFFEAVELRVACRRVAGEGNGRVRVARGGETLGEVRATPLGAVQSLALRLPFGVHALRFEADDGVEIAWVELEHDGPPLIVADGQRESVHCAYRDASTTLEIDPATVVQNNDPWSTLRRGEGEAEVGFGARRRCSVGGDRRMAFWMPGTTLVETAVRVREGDRLRFALGSPRASDTDPWVSWEALPVTYRISWLDGASEDVLFEESFVAAADWSEREVRLPSHVVGDGILRFTTSSEGTEPAAIADVRLVPERPARETPNVLVYVIDSLRPDHLSCYGARNHTSPRLDELARQGFRFENAYAVAPATRPAMGTLWTGYYPYWHGVGAGLPLSGSFRTASEVFAAAGYSTWAAVGNAEIAEAREGFDQGFHRFVDTSLTAERDEVEGIASSQRLNETVLPWIEEARSEPFFLYVHANDPSAPYRVPSAMEPQFSSDYRGALAGETLGSRLLARLGESPAREDVAYVRSVYDDEIRHQDQNLGVLLDALEDAELLEDTVVVVLAGHGELLHEHGTWGHGSGMWEELVRIPLVLWVPREMRVRLGLSPKSVSQGISQVDFLPGLLDLVGVEDPFPRQGRSWRALLGGGEATIRPWIGLDQSAPSGEEVGAYRSSRFKLTWVRGDSFEEQRVYDLRRDPGEERDLSTYHSEMLGRLRRERDALLSSTRRILEELEERGFGHVRPAEERSAARTLNAAYAPGVQR